MLRAGDGWEQWQQRFDAPPLAAYTAASGKIDLLAPEQQQRAAVQGAPSALAPAYAALLPQSPGIGSSSRRRSTAPGSEAVVLVEQNGSVFGIPATRLTFEATPGGDAAAVAAAGEQCQVPAVERLVREQELQGTIHGSQDGKGSALAVLPQPAQLVPGEQQAKQCKPADDVCSAASLGVYAVLEHGSRGLLLLPAGSNESAAGSEDQHMQGRSSTRQLSWLVLLAGIGVGAATSAAVLVVILRRQQEPAPAQAGVKPVPVQNGSTASAAAVVDSSAGGKSRRRTGASSKKQQQMSNRLKGIMHQAAQEGDVAPVTAASDAVIQQQNQQPPQWEKHRPDADQGDDTLPSSAAVAAGLTDPAMRRREVKDGVILIGRMRVSSVLPAHSCVHGIRQCVRQL